MIGRGSGWMLANERPLSEAMFDFWPSAPQSLIMKSANAVLFQIALRGALFVTLERAVCYKDAHFNKAHETRLAETTARGFIVVL